MRNLSWDELVRESNSVITTVTEHKGQIIYEETKRNEGEGKEKVDQMFSATSPRVLSTPPPPL